jgi:flagellar biosynthesis protein FlhB
MVKWTLVCFLGVGAFDFFYQRFQFMKENRMTKEEVKKEYKQMEGDPETKARIKRSRMERMQAGMYRNLHSGGADVVTVNPIHIACALRFDPKKEGAPRLIAKGKGVVAKRIREIADAKSIPIREDPPLARSLFKVELDRVLPEELHEAAAELLKWVAEKAHERGEVAPWEARVDEYVAKQGEDRGASA